MTPRTITTLVLMQLLSILLGGLLTAIFLRFYTTDWPDEPVTIPGFPRFVRNYGFWLCIVPFAWAGASVLSVRSLDALPEVHRRYLTAGYALWVALTLVFIFAVGEAYEGGLRSGPEQMQGS